MDLTPPPPLLTHRSRLRGQRDYSPSSWTQYFDEAHDINPHLTISETNKDDCDTFRVYLRNFQPPYSPARKFGNILDPNDLDLPESQVKNYSNTPTLVLLHGGGYSALTWSEFTRHIEQYCQCRILSIDLRSHGDTKTKDPNFMDIDTLVSDVIAVTHATHKICGFSITPKIVLIGHSMGGAVAVKCATRCEEFLPSLAGFVIIDVVEGTAKDALPLMMSVIKTRPTRFVSLENAIEWSVRSGMTKNTDASKVSMPGNLINLKTGHLGIHDVPAVEGKVELQNNVIRHSYKVTLEQLNGNDFESNKPLPSPRVMALKNSAPPLAFPRPPIGNYGNVEESSELREDDEIEERSQSEQFKAPLDVNDTGYGWRADLAKTQQFWNGWFDGLSSQLLEAPVQGKFLLLAGIDRLDRALTIGQMQGKFMMKVLPKCGHAVHEDLPEQVASCIANFLIHNKFASALE